MKEFFDTSVLVAAFWRGHPYHAASLGLVASASKKRSACALHTIAKVYATMTALPVIDPEQSDKIQTPVSRYHQ
jgi:predicted nucleic acid-binding protein